MREGDDLGMREVGREKDEADGQSWAQETHIEM
jgi:hypothetical protein